MKEWWQTGVENAWAELGVDPEMVELAAERAADHIRWETASLLDALDSPIERKLLLALIAAHGDSEISVPMNRVIRVGESSVDFLFNRLEDVVEIKCQAPVGDYKADFIVSWYHKTEIGNFIASVAVEADGHDFHEKTKEQAAHDKKRDRFFVVQGLSVLRFTGSEIHRASMKCALETMKFLGREVAAAAKAKWEAQNQAAS